MLGSKKSPLKVLKQNKVDPEYFGPPRSNPFDSGDELDKKKTLNPAKRTSAEPNLTRPNGNNNLFDEGDDEGKWASSSSSSSYSLTSADRIRYKNDFRDSGGLENQSVQEMENYAIYKAEETTKAVNGCLKIAEEIRESGINTLVALHQQGEQITRTHNMAVEVDHDLSRGEKLLGSLGGVFSKTWKPKKTRKITGPIVTRDHPSTQRGNHLEQREKLGLNPAPKARSSTRTPATGPTNALQKVELEHAKQDDALSDLSNVLGELKVMAVDMGTELERQTKSLDHFDVEIDELNFRVRGANERGLRLLGR